MLLSSTRNLDNFKTRGQGERSRRCAVYAVRLGLLCRLLVGLWSYMAKSNSPFGAWVVCVYRVEASLEPRVGKCNDLRPFCIPEIGMVPCRQERTPEV